MKNNTIHLLLILIAVLVYTQTGSASNSFFISPLFQNNMVLQQQTNVSFFGKGIPGTKISIYGSWKKKSTGVILPDGNWNVKLQTPKAGGPFSVTIQYGDSSIVLNNVLIGEVWLCSGQSNMEMPLEGWPPRDTISNSAYEIEHATFPNIRLFHVQRNFSVSPTLDCIGTWEECSPTSVRSFSATAYFFGKKLHETLKIPVGLIESAWGGTQVESWTSKRTLKNYEEFTEVLNVIDRCKDSVQVLDRWLSECSSVVVENRELLHKWDGLNFDDAEYSLVNGIDSSWNEMNVPILWEQTSFGNFDGAVWFRKQITIPSNWVGKNLRLHLGPVDDMDETYVNGVLVGSTLGEGFWNVIRNYSIPDSIVQDSIIHIAVRVLDTQGGGGIWSNGEKIYLSCDSSTQTVSLEGKWKYLPVAEYRAGVFSVFNKTDHQFKFRPKLSIDFSAYIPMVLYNGMIAPVVPFTIKGATWYQGESNVSNPSLYKKTFPAMIADWRAAFGIGDFPFYFVQIAPFWYDTLSHSEKLREAQFLSLKTKNSGMAVTLDIAEPSTIHPANKTDVGNRLALWALAKTYNKKVNYSGPLYKSMKIVNNKIILSFDHAGTGLAMKKIDNENNFQISGNDGIFKKASVKIDGKKLTVFNAEIKKPAAVRYAWSNVSKATLFNNEGLPASSFRTDNWEK